MTEVSMDPEDLLILARRGALSQEQQEALDAAAEECNELVDLFDAGLAFDEEGVAQPGDDELCRRLAEEVIASPIRTKQGARFLRARRRPAVWIAAALLAASSAAAAGWTALDRGGLAGLFSSTPPSLEPSQGEPPTPVSSKGTRDRTDASNAASRPPAPLPSVDTSPAEGALKNQSSQRQGGARLRSASSPSPLKAATAAPEASSASLYRQANELRREGHSQRSITLYQQLQKTYPGSSEAQAAALPLAELSLRQGAAREALSQFSSYQGTLRAEALWGKTRALRALGQIKEEERALSELIHSFPSSTFSQAARRRLDEIVLQSPNRER